MAIQYKSKEEDESVEMNIQSAENNAGSRRFKIRYKQHLLLFGSLLILLLIVIVIWMIIVLINYGPQKVSPNNNNLTMQTTSESYLETTTTTTTTRTIFNDVYGLMVFNDPKANLSLTDKVKIVSRKEWFAQPPVEPAKPLPLPVHYIIIGHTGTENCSDQASCVFHVRFLQTFHIESRNWWDIGYNFLVGGDGFAYEGRGWKSEGAHTYGYNSKSIGIAFIGTFNSVLPAKRQILAAQQLIEKGVSLGYVAEDYKILAARQLQTTLSPGLKLYEDMKTWPHWAEQP